MSKDITQVRTIKYKNEFDEDDPWVSVSWELTLLDDTRICYETSTYGQTFTIHLSNKELLHVYPGTKFVLIAYLYSDKRTSEVYIEYSPDSDLTAYFTATGDKKKNQLVYEGAW